MGLRWSREKIRAQWPESLQCKSIVSVHMALGLPPKEEKEEASDGPDSFDSEQIQLNPFCIFDRYFRNNDGNTKGKASLGSTFSIALVFRTCQSFIA